MYVSLKFKYIKLTLPFCVCIPQKQMRWLCPSCFADLTLLLDLNARTCIPGNCIKHDCFINFISHSYVRFQLFCNLHTFAGLCKKQVMVTIYIACLP